MIKLPDEKIHEIAMRAHAACLRIGGSHYNAAQMGIEEVQRLNATAQPVSDGLYRIANHIAGAKNSLPQEWQDWAEEIESDLRKLAAPPGGQDD